jgi:hypothetical protein
VLSTVAFEFNLRRYIEGRYGYGEAAATPDTAVVAEAVVGVVDAPVHDAAAAGGAVGAAGAAGAGYVPGYYADEADAQPVHNAAGAGAAGAGGGNDDGGARTPRWSYNPLAEEDDEVEAEAGEESELTPDIPLDGFTSFANAASVSDPIPLEP